MTAMPDTGITGIAYNHLNLPTQILQNGNTVDYLHRADGVKLKKKYTLVNQLGTKVINTEYLDGFQYSTPNTYPLRMALQEQDASTVSAATAGVLEAFAAPDERIIVDPGIMPTDPNAVSLSFFPTAEGYYDYENFRYIYQYKDHLGNVRVSYVVEDSKLKVMDTNEYYPFGMSWLKPNTGGTSYYDPMAIPYNYKYNGKELQETGMYDYGARMYMPDIGRWGTQDLLTETSRRFSSYAYVNNNPIFFIDPTGMLTDGCPGGKCPDGVTDIKTLPNGQSEVQIQEVVVIGKKKESNPYLRGDCFLCTEKGFAQYHGGQTRSEFNFQRQASLYKGPESGGGGIMMMDSMFDVGGILFNNWYEELEPEDQRGALLLGGVVLILTRNTKIAGAEAKAIMGAEKGSLSATKNALTEAKAKIGLEATETLPKSGTGKFGSPQRGSGLKGYRLDPAHPGRPVGHPESVPHINYWDYTGGKRGSGGVSGAIPIIKL